MKMRRFDILAVLLAMLPMLASCRQELCYDHYPTIDVNFEWEQEWERDYGEHHLGVWDVDYHGCEYDALRPGMPEWINMVNYHKDGRVSEAFLSPDGRSFIVEAGDSRSVLLYNGDTEYIVLSDVASVTDARAEASSRSRASLAAMYEAHQNSRTTNPPDILYAAFVEHVPALNNHDRHQMPIKMQPLVYTYVIRYEFEYGIEHVALARGALGGMAESVYLRTGVTSEETSIILFDCEVKSDHCRAEVHSFGVPGFPDAYYGRSAAPTQQRPYSVNLELMLNNGKTLEFNYDIADQMKNQPRGGVIVIKGIRVEDKEADNSSGFAVDVTEWDDEGEVIELPMGNQPGAIK